MRVISDFRALAANSAQGTGIPAGAVWRYDPQKFMRWVDAEKDPHYTPEPPIADTPKTKQARGTSRSLG